MKVIKRDGKSVDFDPEKIRIAIGKANAQVSEEEGASDTQIENIIKYIQKLNKKIREMEDLLENLKENELKAKNNLEKK